MGPNGRPGRGIDVPNHEAPQRPSLAVTLAALLLATLPGAGITRPSLVLGQSARQVAVIGRVDLFATTRDIRRGIRNNAEPLGELDAVVGLERNGLALTAGAWSAFEPQETRDEPRLDLRVGPAGLSDWSAWLQLTRRVERLSLSAGARRDWYRRVGSDPAVTELYALARLDVGSWSPSLSVWQAVSGADGLYLEPLLAFHPLRAPFVGRVADLAATVRAGFQIGRRNPDGGAKVPGPVGTGLTYVSLGTSIREGFWLVGSLSFVSIVGVEVQYNRDPATRVRRDGRRQDCRFGLRAPIQIGLSYLLGRPR
jgi:hypothetical protein